MDTELKEYFVKIGDESVRIKAHNISWGDGGLKFQLDGKIIALFQYWDYWILVQ